MESSALQWDKIVWVEFLSLFLYSLFRKMQTALYLSSFLQQITIPVPLLHFGLGYSAKHNQYHSMLKMTSLLLCCHIFYFGTKTFCRNFKCDEVVRHKCFPIWRVFSGIPVSIAVQQQFSKQALHILTSSDKSFCALQQKQSWVHLLVLGWGEGVHQ